MTGIEYGQSLAAAEFFFGVTTIPTVMTGDLSAAYTPSSTLRSLWYRRAIDKDCSVVGRCRSFVAEPSLIIQLQMTGPLGNRLKSGVFWRAAS